MPRDSLPAGGLEKSEWVGVIITYDSVARALVMISPDGRNIVRECGDNKFLPGMLDSHYKFGSIARFVAELLGLKLKSVDSSSLSTPQGYQLVEGGPTDQG